MPGPSAAEHGHLDIVQYLDAKDVENKKAYNEQPGPPSSEFTAEKEKKRKEEEKLAKEELKQAKTDEVKKAKVKELGNFLDYYYRDTRRSNKRDACYLIEQMNQYGQTALIMAAENGHVNVVKYICRKYPHEILVRNKYTKHCLLVCCEFGIFSVVKALIEFVELYEQHPEGDFRIDMKEFVNSKHLFTGVSCLMFASAGKSESYRYCYIFFNILELLCSVSLRL